MIDFFGNEIIENVLLRDKFIEPPFSVLDSRQGNWQNRKRQWLRLGIKSELGRGENLTLAKSSDYDYQRDKKKYAKTYNTTEWIKQKGLSGGNQNTPGTLETSNGTSIFDPALCELLYHWFCPSGGTILDPFAGGSVRAIVAQYLNFNYTGIELRKEQVDNNIIQCANILKSQPVYHIGDSEMILDDINHKFDFVFSCPPYFDL